MLLLIAILRLIFDADFNLVVEVYCAINYWFCYFNDSCRFYV